MGVVDKFTDAWNIVKTAQVLWSVYDEGTGGFSVDVQDQTTPPLDLYFIKGTAAPSTLTVEAAIDDRSITVASDANFTVGGYMGLFSGARFYFATVLAKPGANVLELDAPIDFEYLVGSNVQPLTRELGVNGAVTPVIFTMQGTGGTGGDLAIDITRLIFSMICDSAVDLSLFGNLPALTNGITLRRTDGITRNIWTVHTNLDLLNLAYDLTIFAKTNPVQGVDGLGCRYSFAGQDKHGVAVRLFEGEALELVIADDLSALQTATAFFRVIAQGHIVN